ncbi:transcriptional regulator [Rhizobium lusitanum]|uniref:Transcriptional regulator n=2 Tax=Rhizobium lusitanum TaxID=293958 RepID=A0A6L9UHL9_9HYPH|nr:transcriptional regulator [Rhizobium lusitanum]
MNAHSEGEFSEVPLAKVARMTPSQHEIISFGPFTLQLSGRRLLRDGLPLYLGARAFDLLWLLASRPNEVVHKRELLSAVWPEVAVDDGSLRFQITNLRKLLGEQAGGPKYISTVVGRGYCFVAETSRGRGKIGTGTVAVHPQRNLPNRATHIFGRSADNNAIASLLRNERLVTIVGTGGVGKTTVAVSIAHDLPEPLNEAIHFIDLGATSEPSLVVPTVLSTLGVSVQSKDPTSALIAYLANSGQTLLLLDTCEHVIEAVAAMASRILAAAPSTRMLATSREQLQIDGERVYKLQPLACAPVQHFDLNAVQSFPATQLFLQRAAASGTPLHLDESDAEVLANLCRKLDGLPLALELAAARVGSYGLHKTADLLDKHLMLSWPGQRTAPQRQKSLQAALDWSYGLLSDFERRLLHQLALFAGHFSMEAVLDVATPLSDEITVLAAIDSLVAKSMVVAWSAGTGMRYRLLDTTRAHALNFHIDQGELNAMAKRHAIHYIEWSNAEGVFWHNQSDMERRSHRLSALANVRAALDWCFGPVGDHDVGIDLAAAAAPMFLSMSLLGECQQWMSRALEVLAGSAVNDSQEIRLQAALGVSLMFTRGESETARKALKRALVIAEQRGDAEEQLSILGPLHLFHLSTGEFNTSLGYAEQAVQHAVGRDSASSAQVNSLVGVSLHFKGELSRARDALVAASIQSPANGNPATYLGIERSVAGTFLARTLWLQGGPNEAIAELDTALKSAELVAHPLSLSIAMMWACTVFLWNGDLPEATKSMERMSECAITYSLAAHRAVAEGFRGELACQSGDPVGGIALLRQSLQELHQANYKLHTTPLSIALIEALCSVARYQEAIELTLETRRLVEENGDTVYLPELFRLQGRILLSRTADKNKEEAQDSFQKSLMLSREQGAVGWELRTAMDLALLYRGRGRSGEATLLLQSVLEKFNAESNSADLRGARLFLLNSNAL